MKNFLFALLGAVVLFLLISCMAVGLGLNDNADTEKTVEDDETLPGDDPSEPPGTDEPETPLPDDDPKEPPVTDEPESKAPELLINELRTEFAGTDLISEFIEFKILKSGNLDGLKVFIASNFGAPFVYEFLPVEVKEGEYVVLHLRTLEESSVDEYGDDITISGGRDSSATARDIWVPGSTKYLRKTDAVYVLDKDDRVLTAVMIVEHPNQPWPRDNFAETAEFLFSQGAWKSVDGGIGSPADAVISTRTTNTRTINRDETVENTNTAADWYITVTSGASPGRQNNPNRL